MFITKEKFKTSHAKVGTEALC